MIDLSPDQLMLLKSLAWIYFFQFTLFTVLAFVARGRSALRWSPALLKSARVNWSFIVVNMMLAPFALVVSNMAEAFYVSAGIPHIPMAFWSGMPAIVPAVLALILIDFIHYWLHRSMHAPILWPIHAVHHSDTQMHYLTWYRSHVLESMYLNLSVVFLASWFGASPEMVAWVVVARAFHQQYCHTNIDWTHGRLGLFLASPRFHRWHHADVSEAYGKNLAIVMPLWDRLFGTYFCPGPCNEKTGFDDGPGDHFLKLMAYPFVEWGRMLGRAVRRDAPAA